MNKDIFKVKDSILIKCYGVEETIKVPSNVKMITSESFAVAVAFRRS